MVKRKAKPQSPEPSADERALLAAVIGHPDEDTPRLMYADWLQEHGDPARAEFIRAQIEATRLPSGDPNAKALRARVLELVEEHGERWSEAPRPSLRRIFVRGFVEGGQFDEFGDFCDGAAELFACHPLRVVYATYVPEESSDKIAACPHLARLTGLGSNSRGWGGECVARVLANPYLANLKVLDFNNSDYNGTRAARGIASAKHLTNLCVLDLTGNCIQDEGLEALASAKHLSSLCALRLGTDVGDANNDLTADGMYVLARSKSLTSLTQLNLDGNEVGQEGIEHLLAAKWVTNLTELDLAFTDAGEDGLLALARARRLVNLRRLCVVGCGATERVAQAFLRSKWFPNLTELRLYTGIEDELPTEETQVALKERFGPSVFSADNFVPGSMCWEDRIAWRLQTLAYAPPPTTEDCGAV